MAAIFVFLFPLDNREYQGTFGKPHWLENVEKECSASRDGIAVIDLTSTGLFELEVKTIDPRCLTTVWGFIEVYQILPVCGIGKLSSSVLIG